MEYFSNNQISENNIYTPTNSYQYNINYPISSTYTQSTTYTGQNSEGNFTQTYQTYTTDIKTTKEFYNTANTDYNVTYDNNNINLNEFTNYDNYYPNKNYQNEVTTITQKNIYQQSNLNNFSNIKVLPTKYLPTKIIKVGESYTDYIDFATVVPIKEENTTQTYPVNNYISTSKESEIKEYYKSTPEISYSNQTNNIVNYETQIEPQTYNYELNKETNINTFNTINSIDNINTTDFNTVNIDNKININNENIISESEPINLPQENYEYNTVEKINENKVSANTNQQINSPEIYQEQVETAIRNSYTHKSPEINYKSNYLLSPIQSPLAKYETQSYNAEDHFDINEMLRLKEENEYYKEQLKDLNKYKAEAAQVKELREQVEQLSPLKEKVAEMDLLKAQLEELNILRAKVNQLEKLKMQIEQMDNNGQKELIQSMKQNQDNIAIKENEINEKKLLEKKENNENIEPEEEHQELENKDSNNEQEQEIPIMESINLNNELGKKQEGNSDSITDSKNDNEEKENEEDSNVEDEQEQEQEEEQDPEQEQENRDSNIEHEEEHEHEIEEHQEKENIDSNIEQKHDYQDLENRESNIDQNHDAQELENKETNIEQKQDIHELENRDTNIAQKQDSNIEINRESKEIENRDSNIEIEERSSHTFVKGDIIHNIDELEMIIRKINKESNKITLNLLYKATADSDRAKAFHKKCDKAKSTLVLIETDKSKRFGGYTSVDWQGKCIEKNDEEAFVFSLDNMKIYEVIPEEKAIGCYPKFGPVFLGCQIRIYDYAFQYGGTTWEKGLNFNTDEDFVLTGGDREFKVKEIEVYEVITQ